MDKKYSQKKQGFILVFLVYTLWGIQSLYWKLLNNIPIIQLLSHRIIWSFIFMLLVIIASGKINELINILRDIKKLSYIFICAVLIGSNWLLNIYAVYTNQLVEASLGQYITPLLVICCGLFIFKEKVKLHEILALAAAFLGVFIMAFKAGKIPFITVLIVITFTLYTIIKKIININPVLGITTETLILSPFALFYLLYTSINGNLVFFGLNTNNILLLISTGIFTALPLLIYSYGVKLIDLSKMGYIQYLAPTLNLLMGVFIYKEAFTKIHLISFGLIWFSIAVELLYPIIHKNIIRTLIA